MPKAKWIKLTGNSFAQLESVVAQPDNPNAKDLYAACTGVAMASNSNTAEDLALEWRWIDLPFKYITPRHPDVSQKSRMRLSIALSEIIRGQARNLVTCWK